MGVVHFQRARLFFQNFLLFQNFFEGGGGGEGENFFSGLKIFFRTKKKKGQQKFFPTNISLVQV
jgi:hypothetical protein